MALSGIEAKLISKSESVRDKEKIHFISYADDFVITGYTLELLEEKVIPIVIDSLKAVGLELSKEKSKITHIDKGFNFLGHNIRKYKGTLLTKPARATSSNFLS